MLVDNIRDVVFRLSLDGVIQYVSASVSSLYGYRPEDVIGKPFGAVLVSGQEKKAQEAMARVITGADVKYLELLVRTASGAEVPAEVYAAPVRENGKIVAAQGVLRDITERKKSEKRDKEYIQRIQAANRELDNYTYIISHDLQEPLRSIDAFAKFLEQDYQETLSDQGKGYIQRIRANSARMQELIEDLLKISKIERVNNPQEEVASASLIDEVKARLDFTLGQRRARIEVRTPMPLIVCDRLRMLEVFQNLIVNAVKFNDKPEPLVEIGCRRAGDDWEFYVRDNGPGIEERYFQKIFEIFQRLHRREDNDGVGAGLTIAKKIVEMHKGKIWVQSRPGEGAVFYFTIPAITVISSADAGVHHATR
jgi:PAS domain S-box-containing protein